MDPQSTPDAENHSEESVIDKRSSDQNYKLLVDPSGHPQLCKETKHKGISNMRVRYP